MENIIEINDVDVYYEDVSALSNINLKVEQNEFLAILGPNGGGKSTLLKLILGFRQPTCGDIKILGKSPKKSRSLVGYVPQFTKFDKKFPISVEEVVLMGRLGGRIKPFHKFNDEDHKKVEDIMKKLNIYQFKDRQIGQLSGGQMQRVLIARALLIEPKILLLDEPTASLDAATKIQIYELLKELSSEMTIVIVTHDVNIISTYATKIACIDNKLYYYGKAQSGNEVLSKIYSYPIEPISKDKIQSHLEACGEELDD
ncbi:MULTISPECIES: metal ABC transporter ATP-binding protein [Clostridium]|uniref:Zinc ABC transporter, ATP-binding protein n=1 Tax=Clostridium novyi (strain NT) TaxID=386415 RepID=A0PXK3_CLONN|nr:MULTISPECIES: metal ABC transporter ATP-binding protein [Clostridium]ABK61677.1 Zinc ABC transporter, ATP-binding protein [Clostridium novyi NT]KEH87161.1 ABC transporter [Clostridium novyi A str. NCTC 538]KEH89858.1 ABC transporter [Clostridium novyi A str. 4540]KEH90008.1 ABC transporter [Clostridium novyi A str. BKT29909]KEH94414.1 ABC transporter [Clostridium novyi A str. GD211209]